jgi:hypothetical protein
LKRYKNGRNTYHMGLAPRVPVIAGLGHDVGDFHVVDEIVGAFKDRPDKAGRQVPCDVTVEWPDTRVVLVPLQNNIAIGLQLGNVTPGWVGRVGHLAIPAGAILFESLARSAVSDDASVVYTWTSESREAGRVALRRSTGATSAVGEDSVGVNARALGDNLDVVAYHVLVV